MSAPSPAVNRPLGKRRSQYDLARFTFSTPVLPLIADTLPLAEQARRSLLSICKHLARLRDPALADADIWPLTPAFWGKDEQGRPATGHQHAIFLPADEDGDGRIDHLTVFAPMGFNELECQALDRLRHLPRNDDEPLRLLLVGLGREGDFRTSLAGPATVWVSATPFVVTRFPKLRGSKRDRPEDYATPQAFARRVVIEELQRRSLPAPAAIEETRIGAAHLRPIQFQRSRYKVSDDGGRRSAAGFRLTFAAPICGPLALGHSCHFGLGLFLPEEVNIANR